jgi:Arc/MetJ-type ribon-helix-helix transcriptional regulator
MGRKERKEKEKFAEVLIPTSLFNKIKERIKGTGFSSVSSYVTYVLKEVLSEEEEEKEVFTKEDEEKIKARLRALGYID